MTRNLRDTLGHNALTEVTVNALPAYRDKWMAEFTHVVGRLETGLRLQVLPTSTLNSTTR